MRLWVGLLTAGVLMRVFLLLSFDPLRRHVYDAFAGAGVEEDGDVAETIAAAVAQEVRALASARLARAHALGGGDDVTAAEGKVAEGKCGEGGVEAAGVALTSASSASLFAPERQLLFLQKDHLNMEELRE